MIVTRHQEGQKKRKKIILDQNIQFNQLNWSIERHPKAIYPISFSQNWSTKFAVCFLNFTRYPTDTTEKLVCNEMLAFQLNIKENIFSLKSILALVFTLHHTRKHRQKCFKNYIVKSFLSTSKKQTDI